MKTTNETSPTPGPWEVVPCPINKGKHPFHDSRWIMTKGTEIEYSEYVPADWDIRSGSIICEMRDGPTGNARLIAAAPEMLAALETLIDANKNPIGWDWDRARAAISKAKGQP